MSVSHGGTRRIRCAKACRAVYLACSDVYSRVCDRGFSVYLACDRAVVFKVLTRGIDRAFTGSNVVSRTITIQEYTGFSPVPGSCLTGTSAAVCDRSANKGTPQAVCQQK